MMRYPLGLLCAGGLLAATPLQATIPYKPVALPPGAIPAVGPGLISPAATFGKEYSHDVDQSTAGGGGLADPQQIIAWDGLGGAADGLDYSGTRPGYAPDDQVDAAANHNDALFRQLRDDLAHLVFSHDDLISTYPAPPGAGGGGAFAPTPIPSFGPLVTSGGHVIGGAGEISFERAGAYAPPATMGTWAPQAAVNGMPLPRDVDALEVWGPEPGTTGDADKYSLQVDFFSGGPAGGPGTSVWNLSGTPYISHATIAAAVTSLLGPVGSGVLPFPTFIDGDDAINVDALMVLDTIGDPDAFDRDPNGGPGDQIIFSIQQIPDLTDPDGYYATGSELFVLDASLGPAGTTYLRHGGHLWDHSFALSDLVISPNFTDGRYGVLDINAIEAVGELVVPEPASVGLVATLAAAAVWRRRG
ncbi:PEP-CTERM sorting domain-containing protein [Botrimarina sp.]|uniref:PEP-CTERM sorting domain-containing protein n=1 Tax=Botrimarina sp. TaxID=2795802 RepID=UPI0032EB37B1